MKHHELTKRGRYELAAQARRRPIQKRDINHVFRAQFDRITRDGKYFELLTSAGVMLRNTNKAALMRDLAVMKGYYVIHA